MNISVTAHAVLRFLERRYEIDVDALRAEARGGAFITDGELVAWMRETGRLPIAMIQAGIREAVAAPAAAGAREVPYDGLTLCMIGNCVTTVLGQGMRPKRKRNRPLRRIEPCEVAE